METSISLTVVTRRQMFPDGPKELVAVLQIRGEENHENDRPESYPGVCQALVHGKIEPGETDIAALFRETLEELGESFVGTKSAWKCTTENMVETGRVVKPNKVIVHYAIEILSDRLKSIRFNASTGGLRYLRRHNLTRVRDVVHHGYHKATGVESHSITAMFDDDFEATKAAFAHFEKPDETS